MPQYKFFEATKASGADANARKDAEFAEFNLRTNSRSQSRVKRSLTGVEDDSKLQSYVFKAAKMPDFSDTYNGIKPKSPKKLTTFTEFNLSTHNRGTDKQQKLQEMIDSEQRQVKDEAIFRATPVKMNADGTMP